MNFLKDKVNKHKVLTTILALILIVGLVAGGLFITRNKNNSLIEMADSSGGGAIEVPTTENETIVPSEDNTVEEVAPSQDNGDANSNGSGNNNAGSSASGGQSNPRKEATPQQSGGSASSGQSSPAPQQPSTPQQSQPQQTPSRPQWKKVVVGYCDITIGDDFNQSYKNAETCFQKVLPEKPVWCGVAYAPTSGYDCHWNGIDYSIDVNTNYVYKTVRA